ncbi:MAG: IS30 family transposase [Erysipelotrichales bacterium]|nr:IS30 family transposase [Erysipelotrichales bacterium]
MANNIRFFHYHEYNKHLSLDNRILIQTSIHSNVSLKDIAFRLKKDPSTISKEVKKHRVHKLSIPYHRSRNIVCLHFKSCKVFNLCTSGCKIKYCKNCSKCQDFCPSFKRIACKRLSGFPWVCNGCPKVSSCPIQDKYYYYGDVSNRVYKDDLKFSREGINLSKDAFISLDNLVSPLIKKGQSIAHIARSNDIPVSERTLYTYISKQYLTVKNIDLPRLVSYKPRKKASVNRALMKKAYVNRNLHDYNRFLLAHPDSDLVQMDIVEGPKGESLLLTLYFLKSHLMLAFKIDSKSPDNISNVFNLIQEKIGLSLFQKLFFVILTDRGIEFSSPEIIEFCPLSCIQRSNLFYCDPYSPYQKAEIERNHHFIRHFVPKGKSFYPLSQSDIDLMLSHINSYTRKSLNSNSPYDLACLLYGDFFLSSLNIKKIDPNDVFLKPLIFKK